MDQKGLDFGPGAPPRWIQFNNNGKEITQPAKTPTVQLVDAKDAYELVLANAGCWPRDRVTLRTIDEVKTKTGSWGRNAPLEPTAEWFMEGLTPGKAPLDSDGDGFITHPDLSRAIAAAVSAGGGGFYQVILRENLERVGHGLDASSRKRLIKQEGRKWYANTDDLLCGIDRNDLSTFAARMRDRHKNWL